LLETFIGILIAMGVNSFWCGSLESSDNGGC
jgi:hypothetical protein